MELQVKKANNRINQDFIINRCSDKDVREKIKAIIKSQCS
jgi:hypothetical protein